MLESLTLGLSPYPHESGMESRPGQGFNHESEGYDTTIQVSESGGIA